MRTLQDMLIAVFGIVLGILAALGIVGLVSLFTALPTWLLWNWLMPHIFGFVEITYLQAFGLYLLSYLFFGAKWTTDTKGKKS